MNLLKNSSAFFLEFPQRILDGVTELHELVQTNVEKQGFDVLRGGTRTRSPPA